MSWDIAAAYFGLAWAIILPAWNRTSLITLCVLGVVLFPIVFAAATFGNPNPTNEYVSMPALLIACVGLPAFVLGMIGKAMSLRLDYRLRQRDRRG